MDDIRKGQIALFLLEHHLREKGDWLADFFHRDIGNKVGISSDEITELMNIFVCKIAYREEFTKLFNKNHSYSAMSEIRQGQIALFLINHQFHEKGIWSASDFFLVDVCKANISSDELIDIMNIFIDESDFLKPI
jgi:hypothetical protein